MDRDEEEDDEIDEAEADEEPCPYCDGTAFVLGILGSRTHYRCRHCGGDFSRGND